MLSVVILHIKTNNKTIIYILHFLFVYHCSEVDEELFITASMFVLLKMYNKACWGGKGGARAASSGLRLPLETEENSSFNLGCTCLQAYIVYLNYTGLST